MNFKKSYINKKIEKYLKIMKLKNLDFIIKKKLSNWLIMF